MFVGRAGERSYVQVSKGALGFHWCTASPAWKWTIWKLAVELLLLIFVAFKALAERKEVRNGGAGLEC